MAHIQKAGSLWGLFWDTVKNATAAISSVIPSLTLTPTNSTYVESYKPPTDSVTESAVWATTKSIASNALDTFALVVGSKHSGEAYGKNVLLGKVGESVIRLSEKMGNNNICLMIITSTIPLYVFMMFHNAHDRAGGADGKHHQISWAAYLLSFLSFKADSIATVAAVTATAAATVAKKVSSRGVVGIRRCTRELKALSN